MIDEGLDKGETLCPSEKKVREIRGVLKKLYNCQTHNIMQILHANYKLNNSD